MCFSAEASFAVGAALLPAGFYCVRQAVVKRLSYLALAVMPFFFGIQQISEGFVWHGIRQDDSQLTRSASLVFLFFALAFWPFWFWCLTAVMEPQPLRKWILAGFGVVATVWFWVLFYPLVVGPESLLTIRAPHHSIHSR